jgi:hypothetical protein
MMQVKNDVIQIKATTILRQAYVCVVWLMEICNQYSSQWLNSLRDSKFIKLCSWNWDSPHLTVMITAGILRVQDI